MLLKDDFIRFVYFDKKASLKGFKRLGFILTPPHWKRLIQYGTKVVFTEENNQVQEMKYAQTKMIPKLSLFDSLCFQQFCACLTMSFSKHLNLKLLSSFAVIYFVSFLYN